MEILLGLGHLLLLHTVFIGVLYGLACTSAHPGASSQSPYTAASVLPQSHYTETGFRGPRPRVPERCPFLYKGVTAETVSNHQYNSTQYRSYRCNCTVAGGVDGSSNDYIEPYFDTATQNVTVVAGETASLECYVEAKGEHHVVWMNPTNIVLTKDNSRITDDMRISVERQLIRDWHLHIRDVEFKDRGGYSCFINTEPPKMKIVYLDVRVPPRIISTSPSKKRIVREGETVELICNATGVPQPIITWIRRSWDSERERQRQEILSKPGECLYIHNISRYCDGTFECVAYNGVRRNASAKMEIEVVFPPEITMTNLRIGQYLGRETVLECTIHASPFAIFIWERNGRQIQTTTGRYRLDFYDDGPHIKKLSLLIHSLSADQFGQYSCFAKNKYGSDRESMILYDYNTSLIMTAKPTRLTSTQRIISQSPFRYEGSYSEMGVTVSPGTLELTNSSRKLTFQLVSLTYFIMFVLRYIS